MAVHACTIVARNYVPSARVLATTFRAQHPDAHLTVLVTDDLFGEVDGEAEPFELLRISDLSGEQGDLLRMAVLYDVTGYSTAVKPWLLGTLLERGAPSALYLDPDIAVLAPLDDLDAMARAHELVLTPHATSPMPRDGKMASETAILASGVYNLGFIGVGGRSGPFLEFWKERLRRECVDDPTNMRFVDQRWVDFAPGMFDACIVRSPSYNVAYWNLDHRDVRWSGERYEIGGQPLRFFHFSGYSPASPHLLSKYQTDCPRILLSERPDVRRLCDWYGDLLTANGYGAGETPAYGFDRMANGVPIDGFVRRLYRERVDEADAGNAPQPPSPFDGTGAEVLCDWLNEIGDVSAGPARLTRYLATYWAYQPSMQARFPDPQGTDFDRFVDFLRRQAAEGRMHPRLLPAALAGERAREPGSEAGDADQAPANDPHAGPAGVNVAGYFRAELGVGEGARLLVSALEAADVPCRVRISTRTGSRQDHPFDLRQPSRGGTDPFDAPFDTNVVCVNADQLADFATEAGPEFFAGRYTVGQWAWELEEFPDAWPEAFDLVDEIWAVSEFTRKAIAAATEKPVFAVPHAIVAPSASSAFDRGSLGLPEGRFLFLFAFDLLSVLERKNPLGLVDAFTRAFRPDEGPVLVLKAMNGDQRIPDLERIRLAIEGRPDILLIDRCLDVDQLVGLMQLADCYVSLHRSEGFGLTMAEAMALGKPVIATGYSGNLDFMDAETAYLVRWTEGAVPAGCEPYREGAVWAEPDVEDATHLLRHVVEHPEEAAEVGRRAREAVLVEHGPKARGALLRERLEAIGQLRSSPGRAEHAAEGGSVRVSAKSLEEYADGAGRATLVDIARSRPSPDAAAGRLRVAARLYRRLVLRAQRHHDDHQRQVNVALAEAVERVQEEVRLGLSRLDESVRALSGEMTRSHGAHDQVLRAQGERLAEMGTLIAGLGPGGVPPGKDPDGPAAESS